MPLSLPSQVAKDFQTFGKHDVGLVVLCGCHEAHQEQKPEGWARVGEGEFQIFMAKGWNIKSAGLRKVWPDHSSPDRVWREYYQAGGSGGGGGVSGRTAAVVV